MYSNLINIISTTICLVMATAKESLITTSFLVEPITMANVQLHPQVLKAVLLTIVSYGVEESWGIVLMQESPKTSSGKVQLLVFEIKSAYQFIHTGHFLIQTRNGVQPPFLVHQSLHAFLQSGGNALTSTFYLSIRASKSTELPHTYSSSSFLTNSSMQYHLIQHSKQIRGMKRWLNWVRTWPTDQYKVLKWRQMKPISLWDTDLLTLLSVVSWDLHFCVWFVHAWILHVK